MVAVVNPIQGILAPESKAAGHTKGLCVKFLASAVICWMKVIGNIIYVIILSFKLLIIMYKIWITEGI